jgi:large subunit ribosomal protein L16
MLNPKKVKHRKWHKSKNQGNAFRGTELAFGDFGLKAMDHERITARQIEAARRAIIRYLKKGGKLWIRIFPDRPMTTKGVEVPMGGGKGSVDHYVFMVKPGRIIFELGGVEESIAREAFGKAGHKFGIKTKFIKHGN